MTPVRLLFVLTQPVRGGVEEVVLALLRRLDPGEFRLGLAAPRPLLEACSRDLAGVPVEAEAIAAESLLDRREVARLARFMARFAPHVVNPHIFRSTAVAAPLARWHGARVVETYHGREGWRRGWWRGGFLPDRLISRLVDRVIAVSEAARTFLIRGKGYPGAKVTVVPNGRDLSVFQPGHAREAARKELGLDRAVPLVGVVGRLEAQKGHAHLLDAWPAVMRELPDARLLLVGDGSLRGALEAQARARGVGDAVIFAGFRADVPRMLDALDVLCLPSLYEGMPLTAIEASAMARPVVATAVDGTPEVVRDGRTGRLVPPADPPALARALLELLRDPDGARRMGEAGRRWARLRFDLDRQVAATARVYRSVAR
ncbi:MAG TPA: glycosyltransferase family 4 protein [Methylomirabilota bacterium]|nr:glycosyltransferase family 4 protein [Methylomirabilota bacterium]